MTESNFTPLDIEYVTETPLLKIQAYIKENKALVAVIASLTGLSLLVSGFFIIQSISGGQKIAEDVSQVSAQAEITTSPQTLGEATSAKKKTSTTPTRTPTRTPTKSPSPTPKATETQAPTSTPVPTSTPNPTATNTPTVVIATSTPIPTNTPTSTPTPTPSATHTPSVTVTSTPTQ